MGLNKEAVDSSKKLLNKYYDDVVDEKFIRYFITMIEDTMQKKINYQFVNCKVSPATLDTKDLCLYIDPVNMPYSLEENINIFRNLYPEIDEILLRNFFATGTILHEIYHLDQADGVSPYEEIRRLYRMFYDAMDRSMIKRIKYYLDPRSFFHERNAWILSSIDLANIYANTALEPVATNLYLASIMDGYEYHTCPVKSTFENIRLPYGFDLRGIPFAELLYNGFMVEEDKYNQVIDFLGDTPVEELKVQEIDQKIKGLR